MNGPAQPMAQARDISGHVPRLAWLLLFICIWEGFARTSQGAFILASPVEIACYLWQNTGLMSRALLTTLRAALIGFVLGNIAGAVLAIFVVLVPRSARLTGILALLVFCLPLVATGPILRVIFGPGEGPQITLAALAVYYTTFLSLQVGLKAVPQGWSDLVRSYGRGRVSELFHIRLRASVPYLIAALQIAAPAAFLGAMVGEFTGAERGMGVLTIRAIRSLDIPATWSLALVAACVSILAYWAFGKLGHAFGTAAPALLMTSGSIPAPPPVWRSLLSALVAIAIALLLWQGVMDIFDLNRFFAKRPADIWTFLIGGPDAASNRAVLFAAYGDTLAFALPGYLAGLILGAGLAAALVLWPGLSAALVPLAVTLRSVPIVTTAPLIALALGRGAIGTITIITVMIFFPTVVACAQGLRQTPGQIRDVFDSYAATPLRFLLLARLPAMLPAFFASARMAIPAALLAATTAEWLATGNGIGSLMALTASTSDYNMLWSAVVLLCVTASAAYLAVERVERAVLRVYASEQVAL